MIICKAGDRGTDNDQCVFEATHKARIVAGGYWMEAEVCEAHAELVGEIAKAFSLPHEVKEIA